MTRHGQLSSINLDASFLMSGLDKSQPILKCKASPIGFFNDLGHPLWRVEICDVYSVDVHANSCPFMLLFNMFNFLFGSFLRLLLVVLFLVSWSWLYWSWSFLIRPLCLSLNSLGNPCVDPLFCCLYSASTRRCLAHCGLHESSACRRVWSSISYTRLHPTWLYGKLSGVRKVLAHSGQPVVEIWSSRQIVDRLGNYTLGGSTSGSRNCRFPHRPCVTSTGGALLAPFLTYMP